MLLLLIGRVPCETFRQRQSMWQPFDSLDSFGGLFFNGVEAFCFSDEGSDEDIKRMLCVCMYVFVCYHERPTTCS